MLLQVLIISKMDVCLGNSIDLSHVSEDAMSDTHHGPPKKKARSDVWENYKLVEGEKKVLCTLCNHHKKYWQ